jgi:hypothetical protein
MRRKSFAVAVLFSALLAACGNPKYVHRYKSIFKDFTANVPWGWGVITDVQGGDFDETRFYGPFDGDFFLGAPSLSVRWFKNNHAHVLRNGQVETYANADDFIDQTLRQVYGYPSGTGPTAFLKSLEKAPDGEFVMLDKPVDIPKQVFKDTGLTAKSFIIESPLAVAKGYRWGVDVRRDIPQKQQARSWNMRMHAYAVFPMSSGFYVICYPATRRGFYHDLDRFFELVNSFRPLTEGPGGSRLTLHRVD